MHGNFTYSLLATICFFFGCTNPLDLEVSVENNIKIRNQEDLDAISIAEQELAFSWYLSEYADASAGGVLSRCAELFVLPRGKHLASLEDIIIAVNSQFKERKKMADSYPGLIVPEGTTYRELLLIHSNIKEEIGRLTRRFQDVCELQATIRENRQVSIHATPPIPAPITEPYGSKPSEIQITNNSDRSIGKGNIEWRIHVAGRVQPIATGRIPTTFIGGLDVGETIKQSWGVRHFHAFDEIRQAVEVFGEDQMLMRACFTEAFLARCQNVEDELAVALRELEDTIRDLRAIQAELFDSATEVVDTPTTKT